MFEYDIFVRFSYIVSFRERRRFYENVDSFFEVVVYEWIGFYVVDVVLCN